MNQGLLPMPAAAECSPSFGRFRISGLMFPAAAAKAAANPEPALAGLLAAEWLDASSEGRLCGVSLLGTTIGPNRSLNDRTGGLEGWL